MLTMPFTAADVVAGWVRSKPRESRNRIQVSDQVLPGAAHSIKVYRAYCSWTMLSSAVSVASGDRSASAHRRSDDLSASWRAPELGWTIAEIVDVSPLLAWKAS